MIKMDKTWRNDASHYSVEAMLRTILSFCIDVSCLESNIRVTFNSLKSTEALGGDTQAETELFRAF